MASLEEEIVQAARAWIGTPYRHQASCRGAGADCLGLVRGIWRDIYGDEPETSPAYTADWGEPWGEEILWQAAQRHLHEVSSASALNPGQVLLFRMRQTGIAKHLGIFASSSDGQPSFVHAMNGRGVLESPLSRPWARRVMARFTFPDKE